MKQNERILVYLVTGFLAVILMVAVFFGRESGPGSEQRAGGNAARNLGDILNQKPVGGATGGATDGGGQGAQPADGPGAGPTDGGAPPRVESDVQRTPLVASQPASAAERVAQHLGESRRDRTVRIVRARAGDSLESLVRRWCGARQPFLDQAKALNETLTMVRPGQEVAVPWVDDEDVLAAYEARQPQLLAGEPGGAEPTPAVLQTGPTFQVPGTGTGAGAATEAAAGTRVYVVQAGDSYWKIAANLYGKGNADRMVREIRRLNPAATDVLQVDQKLVVPAN